MALKLRRGEQALSDAEAAARLAPRDSHNYYRLSRALVAPARVHTPPAPQLHRSRGLPAALWLQGPGVLRPADVAAERRLSSMEALRSLVWVSSHSTSSLLLPLPVSYVILIPTKKDLKRL